MSLGRVASLLLSALPLAAQINTAHKQIHRAVDAHASQYVEASKAIWDFAEPGYKETKSSVLLQSALSGAGFRIESGVAGEPTAFIASFGQGQPIISILGEFDALPGLSQAAVPDRSAVTEGAPDMAADTTCWARGPLWRL